MTRHLSLLGAAADLVVRLRGRSLVVVASLAAILTPFLAATAVFEGVRREAARAVAEGADLYVSSNQAGRNGPLPTSWVGELARIPGVTRVVPRLVGRDSLVDPVVLVGLPLEEIPAQALSVEGRLPRQPGEAVVGAELLHRLNLVEGKSFTFRLNPGIPLKVVGRFHARAPLWASRLVFTDLATAQAIFALEGQASEILLYTRPGDSAAVYDRLTLLAGADHGGKPLRVVSRDIAAEMLRLGFTRRGGTFSALYLVGFALAVPLMAVASGFGFSERRREVALLRATGWQTTEVLELVLLEHFLLALAGATTALLVAILWVKGLNGLLLGQLLLPEAGLTPGFDLPARFLPVPAVLAYLLAAALTMTGSLATAYRAATVPPLEVLR